MQVKVALMFLTLVFNGNFFGQWIKKPGLNQTSQKIEIGQLSHALSQFLTLYFSSSITDDQIHGVIARIDKGLNKIEKSRKDSFFGSVTGVNRNIIHRFPAKPEMPGFVAVDILLLMPIAREQKKFDLTEFLVNLSVDVKDQNSIPFAGHLQCNAFLADKFDSVTKSKYLWLKPMCFYAEFKIITDESLYKKLSGLVGYTEDKDWSIEVTNFEGANEIETSSKETLFVDCYFNLSNQQLALFDKTKSFQAETNIFREIEVKKVFLTVIRTKVQRQEVQDPNI